MLLWKQFTWLYIFNNHFCLIRRPGEDIWMASWLKHCADKLHTTGLDKRQRKTVWYEHSCVHFGTGGKNCLDTCKTSSWIGAMSRPQRASFNRASSMLQCWTLCSLCQLMTALVRTYIRDKLRSEHLANQCNIYYMHVHAALCTCRGWAVLINIMFDSCMLPCKSRIYNDSVYKTTPIFQTNLLRKNKK